MIPNLDVYKKKWQIESDPSIKPGLEAICDVLGLVGNPEQQLQTVHVVGTNGKGSTITFLEGICRAHGLKVGKFMSPCISDLHDQIQLDGRDVSPEELDRAFEKMHHAGVSGQLTDFELLTVAAFLVFAESDVDIVLLECGMGGRFDSTNVVTPLVSIIPSIALEHTQFLGETLADIAYHKAGIIKKGRPVVIGDLPSEAWRVMESESVALQAPMYTYKRDFAVSNEETYTDFINKVEITHLDRKMKGHHQRMNMALSIRAFHEIANQLSIPFQENQIRLGVRDLQLANRLEEIAPNLFLDGAHNPASAKCLVETIQSLHPNQPVHFIVGMLQDKDVRGVLTELEKVGKKFTFIDFENNRAMSAQELMDSCHCGDKCITNDLVKFLSSTKGNGEFFVITGSLYLLSQYRMALLECSSN